MNKAELITAVAQKSGLTRKDADKVVASVLESITETLASGEKVSIVGFGTFEVRERGARTGRDPRHQQGDPDSRFQGPCLQGWQALKDTVNNK